MGLKDHPLITRQVIVSPLDVTPTLAHVITKDGIEYASIHKFGELCIICVYEDGVESGND